MPVSLNIPLVEYGVYYQSEASFLNSVKKYANKRVLIAL